MVAELDDTIRVDTAARLLDPGKATPMAVCPRCGTPLVFTFEFRGAEFVCMTCRGLLGFLAPDPADWTAELQARHDELKALYQLERERREAGLCNGCGGTFLRGGFGPDDRTTTDDQRVLCRPCADADPTVEVLPW